MVETEKRKKVQHCAVKRRIQFHTQYKRTNGRTKPKIYLKSTIRIVWETETWYGGLVFANLRLQTSIINYESYLDALRRLNYNKYTSYISISNVI